MNNNTQVLFALECGHAAPGPIVLSKPELFCAWHRDEQKVTGVTEFEWCAKCRICTFIRWAGLSKHNAEIFAQGHSRRNPDHVVGPEFRRNPNAKKAAERFSAIHGGKA